MKSSAITARIVWRRFSISWFVRMKLRRKMEEKNCRVSGHNNCLFILLNKLISSFRKEIFITYWIYQNKKVIIRLHICQSNNLIFNMLLFFHWVPKKHYQYKILVILFLYSSKEEKSVVLSVIIHHKWMTFAKALIERKWFFFLMSLNYQ